MENNSQNLDIKTTVQKIILIIIAVLGFSAVMHAQVKFPTKEYFTTSIAIDPGASIKNGLNITPELELVSGCKYIKVNSQIQPSLLGGYIDFVGTFGFNLTSGLFEQYRLYSGVRLGHIRRSSYGYPLYGFEAGVDYNIENIFIGLRATGDYRTDYKFSDGNPAMRYSGTIRIGTKF